MHKIAVVILLAGLALTIDGHGRFMKPPNRSSIFRDPAFSHLNPPENWDDDSLYCGAIHQEQVVGGNCGVCGDRFTDPTPRDNELGGKYFRGIITGNYQVGQVIDVEVQLTAGHLGYMEWRLCTSPIVGETQACFNQNLLQRADGQGSKLPVTTSGWYRTQLRLPAGVRCSHCVIQWNYRAGNNWGQCEDGSFDMGCGPQETFRGCSDVQIN